MKTAQVLAVTIGCLLSLFASGKHVTGYGYMVNNKLNNMAKVSVHLEVFIYLSIC